MHPVSHPGRLLKRELEARSLSGNRPCFWLKLQSQYDIALVERDRGAEIDRQVQPATA